MANKIVVKVLSFKVTLDFRNVNKTERRWQNHGRRATVGCLISLKTVKGSSPTNFLFTEPTPYRSHQEHRISAYLAIIARQNTQVVS